MKLKREAFLMEDLIQMKAGMLDVYLGSPTINEFLEKSANVLGNPLILLDNSYKIVSHSNAENITDPYWQSYVNRGFCSVEYVFKAKQLAHVTVSDESPYFFPCQICHDTKLVKVVKNRGVELGFLLMLDSQRELTSDDKILIDILGKMVSELLSKNERNRLSTQNTEMIVIDLLDQSIHSSKELAERIENKQLLQISNWRLLIIDFWQQSHSTSRSRMTLREIQDRFQELLQMKTAAVYQEKVVIIFDSISFQTNKESLSAFATKHGLKISVSADFSDLLQTNQAYIEALECDRLARFSLPVKPLTEYYEVNLYSLLPSMPIEQVKQKYFHPVLQKLIHYDLAHHTDLFETLYTYLLQHENVNHTAICLSIHRNTVRYKLKRASEIGEFSYSNSVILAQLLISYQIFSYYVVCYQDEYKNFAKNQLLQLAFHAFERISSTKCASCTIQDCDFRL